MKQREPSMVLELV